MPGAEPEAAPATAESTTKTSSTEECEPLSATAVTPITVAGTPVVEGAEGDSRTASLAAWLEGAGIAA